MLNQSTKRIIKMFLSVSALFASIALSVTAFRLLIYIIAIPQGMLN